MIDKPSEAKRPWWSWLGPWPLRPWILSLSFALFYAAYVVAWISQAGAFEAATLARAVAGGVVLIATSWAIAAMGRRWQRRHGVHVTSYVLFLLTLGLIGPVVRAVGFGVETHGFGWGALVVAFIRPLVLFAAVSAAAGIAFARVEREVAATKAALDLARAQQVQIIAADEEARRQVSLLLHDRVQSGILATCLELRAVAKRMAPADGAELAALADKLEGIRSIDVRRAARTLSPNLQEVDLQTALEDLASQYEASFVTAIDVPTEVDRRLTRDAPFTALAVYRVVDQSLLNAAAHAGATLVGVRVAYQDGWFSVRVDDNGCGLPNVRQPGLGTTIINTWVRATGGFWSLENAMAGRGCLMTAHLRPLARAGLATDS